MHVYMDAVFYPNIYEHDEIFRQEGWSYKLDDVDGKLEYNGVVYNEMKGAFSSPEGVLDRVILNSLFPDTSYANESGGDPEVIPELTSFWISIANIITRPTVIFISMGIWIWQRSWIGWIRNI